MPVLAVDVGGTKVATATVDRAGSVIRKTHQPTDLRGAEMVIDQIVAMSRTLLDGETPLAVGVSVPAVLENLTDRILWAPNLPGWEGADVKGMLSDRLDAPTTLEYDGHAAALGEWWAGAGGGYDSMVSIVIGTGIGAGFIEGGKLMRGRDRLAGAIGWFPVDTPTGIISWEKAASGPAIARRALQFIEQGWATRLQTDDLTAKSVFDAARQGDDLACRVIEETAHYVGLGIAAVVSFANPQIVILGGSVGQHSDLMLPTVRRVASEWAQPYSARDLSIVCSRLGEEAGLLGAAYSAFQQLDP